MRKLLLILLIISQLSCSSVSYKSVPTSEERYLQLSNSLKNMDKDDCYLIFTKEFNEENIEVKTNENIIYNNKISTNGYQTAEVVKVKNSSNIEINIEGINKPVKIKTDQIKIYKFIFIEKKNRKVKVEFNNNMKKLEGKWRSSNI